LLRYYWKMIKRVTAISFILVANIIMLAHIMLPHHQHHGEIVVVHSHHESCSDTHEHDHGTPDHDDGHDVQCCVLAHDFIIPSKQIKQENKLFDDKFNKHGSDLFQAIFSKKISIGLTQFKFFGNPPPLITSADSLFINRVFGLRAPPIV
jgi:hypothetical protein